MPFSRPASMAFPDERYLSQQPAFQTSKTPDPLSDNWNYDSAIDLFSLNTMPDPFTLDLPDDIMNFDPRDLPVDAFAPPPGISGFTISNHSGEESISSDPESDDQLWSPTCRAISSLDSSIPSKQDTQASRRKTNPRKRQSAATTRWSSSPEITPKEDPGTPPPPKMSRSLSGDSNPSANSRNAAKRAAHNIIEKRYRTNMNAKFVALEKAMSGSGVQKPSKGGSASLKKSEILSNAITYMEELQEENKRLHKEMTMLKQNLLPGGIWRHTKQNETNFG